MYMLSALPVLQNSCGGVSQEQHNLYQKGWQVVQKALGQILYFLHHWHQGIHMSGEASVRVCLTCQILLNVSRAGYDCWWWLKWNSIVNEQEKIKAVYPTPLPSDLPWFSSLFCSSYAWMFRECSILQQNYYSLRILRERQHFISLSYLNQNKVVPPSSNHQTEVPV